MPAVTDDGKGSFSNVDLPGRVVFERVEGALDEMDGRVAIAISRLLDIAHPFTDGDHGGFSVLDLCHGIELSVKISKRSLELFESSSP